jgi:hypothetical protein
VTQPAEYISLDFSTFQSKSKYCYAFYPALRWWFARNGASRQNLLKIYKNIYLLPEFLLNLLYH